MDGLQRRNRSDVGLQSGGRPDAGLKSRVVALIKVYREGSRPDEILQSVRV